MEKWFALKKKIESMLPGIGKNIEKWGDGSKPWTIEQAVEEKIEKIPDKRFEDFVKEFISGFWQQFSDGVTCERWWGGLEKVSAHFGCSLSGCHSFDAGSHQTLPHILHLCRIVDSRITTSKLEPVHSGLLRSQFMHSVHRITGVVLVE